MAEKKERNTVISISSGNARRFLDLLHETYVKNGAFALVEKKVRKEASSKG